jgi:hypothetical protein
MPRPPSDSGWVDNEQQQRANWNDSAVIIMVHI